VRVYSLQGVEENGLCSGEQEHDYGYGDPGMFALVVVVWWYKLTGWQAAKFVVDQPEGTNDFISEEQVPPGLRFPALFKGQGVRGHAYHVFNEPRYFA
jgi:hypothetical protein